MTQLRQKPIYSYKKYEDVLWIERMPVGMECVDAFRNNSDDWLYVKKPNFPTKPVVPEEIQEWIMIDSNQRTLSVNKSIKVNIDS